MQAPGATLAMAKAKKRPVGRPKAPEPLKSLLSLKASQTYEDWLDRLVKHARLASRSHLVRIALEDYAAATKFEPPPDR